MKDSDRSFWVIWKGEKKGPFQKAELISKIKNGEVGRLFAVFGSGIETTAGEFFDDYVEEARKSASTKSIKTSQIRSDRTTELDAPSTSFDSSNNKPSPLQAVSSPPIPPKQLPKVVAPAQVETVSTFPPVTVLKQGRTLGPFSLDQLYNEIRQGKFDPSDLAWHEGLSEWVRLDSLQVPDRPMPASTPPPIPFVPIPANQTVQHIHHQIPASRPTPVIVAGYLLCLISCFFFPPFVGLAAFIIGIVVCAKGSAVHGVAIIVLSILCALAGMFLGVAMIANSIL